MSQEIFMRGLFSGLFSLAFAWVVFSRFDAEIGSESTEGERQKYLPYIPGNLLPLFLLVLLLFGTAHYGITQAAGLTLSMCFGIFLHISVYYLVLVFLLPALRRYMSARACAMLWIIPNYLYIVHQSYMTLPVPRFVISVPGQVMELLFFIWATGFAIVLFWKTAEHILFRRRVLKEAQPVTDPAILDIWRKAIEDARFKKPRFQLVTSPRVTTPLSVGLFQRSTRVVLPRRDYTPEELELILRHEIIHIGREDAWNKFFLVFCTAMCWFNPLMWLAMGKSAEDLELSCDETVLLGADEDKRKRYASLLLDTAGDDRGYTTCLSATARAMRHRLRSVTQTPRRRSGALVVCLAFFTLCMSYGYTALAYGGVSGTELIYADGEQSQYALRKVTMDSDAFQTEYLIDQEAFHTYLSGLTCYRLTGNYSLSKGEHRFTYLLDTPKGTVGMVICDDSFRLVPLYGEDRDPSVYHVPEGVDWSYLQTVVRPLPAMNIQLMKEGDAYGHKSSAYLATVREIADGTETLLYDGFLPEGETRGVFGTIDYQKGVISFSQELAATCSVLVETWDRSGSYTVTQEDPTQPFSLEIPDYPAHYTIYASFSGPDGTTCEAEFLFDIGEIDNMS